MNAEESELLVTALVMFVAYAILVFEKVLRESSRRKP